MPKALEPLQPGRSEEIAITGTQPAKRVFIVDDEPTITSTLALILRHFGFDVTAFNAPLDALQAATAKTPDVLISDVVMPQISGIELALRIRELAPACKVMLLSGQALTASLLENAQAGGNDFEILLKPMHPRELVSRLQRAVG